MLRGLTVFDGGARRGWDANSVRLMAQLAVWRAAHQACEQRGGCARR